MYKTLKHLILITLISTAGVTIPSLAGETISGAKVVNDNCARCHNSRPIQEFSLAEWRVIMPHMREKAHLTGGETKAVLAFFELASEGQAPAQAVNSNEVKILSGEQLVTRYGCQGCHQIDGAGGTLGPALDNVVADKGLDFFIEKVRNPQFNNPASAMPKMPISEAEAIAIAELLKR